MPWQQDPAARIGGDETGLSHTNALVNASAWASEIEMLRVIRSVADLVRHPLSEVARLHRELSLVEIAQQHGATRDAVLDVVMASLRVGEPIAGLWHQRAELRHRAEQIIDRKPRHARPRQEQSRQQLPGRQQGRERGQAQQSLDARRGPDADGHLDTHA